MNYDTWKSNQSEPTDLRLPPCVVCTGEEFYPPCSEECADIVRRVDVRRRIVGLYQDAKRCLRFARIYMFADGEHDYRVRNAMRRVQLLRAEISTLRSA